MQFYLSVFNFPTFPTVNLFFINHSFNEIAFSGSLTNQSAGDFNGLLEFHNFFIDSLSESPNIVIPLFYSLFIPQQSSQYGQLIKVKTVESRILSGSLLWTVSATLAAMLETTDNRRVGCNCVTVPLLSLI